MNRLRKLMVWMATAGRARALPAGGRGIPDISPRRDAQGVDDGVSVHRISSQAGSKLGAWFEFAGLTQDESTQGSGLIARTTVLRQDNRSVRVKVEEIR